MRPYYEELCFLHFVEKAQILEHPRRGRDQGFATCGRGIVPARKLHTSRPALASMPRVTTLLVAADYANIKIRFHLLTLSNQILAPCLEAEHRSPGVLLCEIEQSGDCCCCIQIVPACVIDGVFLQHWFLCAEPGIDDASSEGTVSKSLLPILFPAARG